MQSRFNNFRLKALLFIVALPVVFAASAGAATANNDLSPGQASAALYERMSARDLDGVLRLIPPEGLSETGTDGSAVHHLDRKAFERLFNSDMSIDLHAGELAVRRTNDVAIVTGVRTGAITKKNAVPKPARMLFSMVWVMDGEGGWRLHHLHMSPL